jgi:hypothetical protein
MSKLYNNARDQSKKTLGTGYGSKEKAIETLKIIKSVPQVKQTQIVVTMFNRAKFHKYRNKNMEAAMRIFSIWMKKRGIKHTFRKNNTKSNQIRSYSKNTKKYSKKNNIKYVQVCSGKGPTEPPCKKGSKKIVKYSNLI